MEGFLSTSVDFHIADAFGTTMLEIIVKPISANQETLGHFANIKEISEYFGE